MATLKIELETDGFTQTPAEFLHKLADRINEHGLPTDGAYLLRDITGDIAGQATIATRGE